MALLFYLGICLFIYILKNFPRKIIYLLQKLFYKKKEKLRNEIELNWWFEMWKKEKDSFEICGGIAQGVLWG